jgi:hypothetical protein
VEGCSAVYEPAWSNSLCSFQRAQSGKGASMNEDEIRDQGPAVRAHVWTRCSCSWNCNEHV